MNDMNDMDEHDSQCEPSEHVKVNEEENEGEKLKEKGVKKAVNDEDQIHPTMSISSSISSSSSSTETSSLSSSKKDEHKMEKFKTLLNDKIKPFVQMMLQMIKEKSEEFRTRFLNNNNNNKNGNQSGTLKSKVKNLMGHTSQLLGKLKTTRPEKIHGFISQNGPLIIPFMIAVILLSMFETFISSEYSSHVASFFDALLHGILFLEIHEEFITSRHNTSRESKQIKGDPLSTMKTAALPMMMKTKGDATLSSPTFASDDDFTVVHKKDVDDENLSQGSFDISAKKNDTDINDNKSDKALDKSYHDVVSGADSQGTSNSYYDPMSTGRNVQLLPDGSPEVLSSTSSKVSLDYDLDNLAAIDHKTPMNNAANSKPIPASGISAVAGSIQAFLYAYVLKCLSNFIASLVMHRQIPALFPINIVLIAGLITAYAIGFEMRALLTKKDSLSHIWLHLIGRLLYKYGKIMAVMHICSTGNHQCTFIFTCMAGYFVIESNPLITTADAYLYKMRYEKINWLESILNLPVTLIRYWFDHYQESLCSFGTMVALQSLPFIAGNLVALALLSIRYNLHMSLPHIWDTGYHESAKQQLKTLDTKLASTKVNIEETVRSLKASLKTEELISIAITIVPLLLCVIFDANLLITFFSKIHGVALLVIRVLSTLDIMDFKTFKLKKSNKGDQPRESSGTAQGLFFTCILWTFGQILDGSSPFDDLAFYIILRILLNFWLLDLKISGGDRIFKGLVDHPMMNSLLKMKSSLSEDLKAKKNN